MVAQIMIKVLKINFRVKESGVSIKISRDFCLEIILQLDIRSLNN